MSAKLRLHAAPATFVSLAVILGSAVALAATRAPATFGGKKGRIAFASTPDFRDETKFEIYTMKADGSDARRLTNNAAFDAGPTYSPAGKRIAFVSHRDGNYEIYLMKADGTDQRRLTHNPAQDRQPAFSPNGKRIAFASDRKSGDFQIFMMNADGTDQHRLTHRRRIEDDPTFFPGGKKIAFVRVRAGVPGLFTMRADGTHFHDLGTPGFTPVFSPSGKKIAFERAVKGGRASRIFVMRADGSDRHALTMPPDRFNEFPDWGPRP